MIQRLLLDTSNLAADYVGERHLLFHAVLTISERDSNKVLGK